MACFGFGKRQVKEPILPFTTFVLKVDPTGTWESTVAKVLKKTKEVSNFTMHSDGELQISGTLNPALLLKVLAKSGKAAQLVHWKFGGCSRNLHMPEYEQIQQCKRYWQYLADIQAHYNEIHGIHGGGQGQRYDNHQYLRHPQVHPNYGLPGF